MDLARNRTEPQQSRLKSVARFAAAATARVGRSVQDLPLLRDLLTPPLRDPGPEYQIKTMTDEEARELLEHEALTYLGMSADDFAKAWHEGKFGPDERTTTDVLRVAMLLRFVEGSKHSTVNGQPSAQ